MTAFWLYLWVKLDDIINLFQSDYGITVLLAVACIVYLCSISMTTPDCEGDRYPLSGFFSDDERTKGQLRATRSKLFKLVVTVWVIQFSFNVVATLLPTTKQLAVIYTISTGVQSETFNALKSLDKDFATYLQTEAKSWLKEQANTIKNTNTVDKEEAK